MTDELLTRLTRCIDRFFPFLSFLAHKARQLAELGLLYRGSPAIIRTRGLRHFFLAQSEGLPKDNLPPRHFPNCKALIGSFMSCPARDSEDQEL